MAREGYHLYSSPTVVCLSRTVSDQVHDETVKGQFKKDRPVTGAGAQAILSAEP